eukprot:2250650-Pleurochrysis_carterae.AAC.2
MREGSVSVSVGGGAGVKVGVSLGVEHGVDAGLVGVGGGVYTEAPAAIAIEVSPAAMAAAALRGCELRCNPNARTVSDASRVRRRAGDRASHAANTALSQSSGCHSPQQSHWNTSAFGKREVMVIGNGGPSRRLTCGELNTCIGV